MKEKLLTLSAYTNWANLLMFNVLVDTAIQDKKLIFWASHIINAEIIWLDRIEGIPVRVSPSETRAVDTLIPAISECHQRFVSFLEATAEKDLTQKISYKTTRGMAFENELSDILFHLINHSTHHRSQMAARLRELGIVPPATDYIFYKREGK